MTSKENIAWMKKEGHYKQWIQPEHDLFKGLTYYKEGKFPGNHAGAMPWDSSCNKDHDDIVLRHVAATSRMPREDPRKFMLATPADVASAYKRIYNNPVVYRDGKCLLPPGQGGPPPHRLGHDIMKVKEYWRGVFDNKGLNVGKNANDDRGNEGREAGKSGEKDSGHGGVRPDRVQVINIMFFLHKI